VEASPGHLEHEHASAEVMREINASRRLPQAHLECGGAVGRLGRSSLWLCVLLSLFLSSCMFRQLRRNLAEINDYAVLRGTVHTEHPTDLPIFVVIFSGAQGKEQLVDDFVLAGPGPYFFFVPAGTYQLGAFEDVDRTFTYKPGVDPSALLRGGKLIAAEGGATIEGLDISIREAGRDRIPFVFSPTMTEDVNQRSLAEFHIGEVTRIDDPRFSPENARRGLWQPADFLREVGAGVYFLEPYDPKKVPVLFVHGALGYPGNFASLISRLDRNRFQPWVAYYPTAMPLAAVATFLDRWLQYLYVQYHYPHLAVVAHSMGGLVARAFVNRVIAAHDGRTEGIRLFFTMSTPWDGHAAAQSGVDRAPVVAPSWYDMAPGSPFLRTLLDPALPPTLGHDLLFSFAGGSRRIREANDGTVTVASQLEPRVQSHARTVRGFNETHTSILENVEVAALLNLELAAATGQ
jgi:pimeloyl-ACP methyl ester carboxylesterase